MNVALNRTGMRGGRREGAGRPKGKTNLDKREFQEIITGKDIENAVKAVRDCLNSDNQKLRLDAAAYLIDQKFGKARQKLDTNLTGGIMLVVNDLAGQLPQK